MKTVIYYLSKSGHTEKYAHSLASRLEADLFSYKKMSKKVMKQYDTIIYMACVYANKIRGVEKFLKFYDYIEDKNVVIVFVGMQPKSPEVRETVITTNLLDAYHIRLYQLVGGFDISKVSFPYNLIMKYGFKAAAKKGDFGADAQARVDTFLTHPYEVDDLEGIENIVTKIRNIK